MTLAGLDFVPRPLPVRVKRQASPTQQVRV